ncbi:DndE family protein [Chryseobacterium sediminis]|uniref:DndE family protein n=1 Tax=Chryseobacterium sediminis TaxID=1679494 RepID=UPI0028621210|nr:DndE family protein [Chryseobacterium sediminis]MDR6462682.1 DNA sulfur modification protein DndE [Chryseobacterium sediminis]
MFNQIKTSKSNKDIVVQLTKRLNLGTENIIARMAFSYSLSQERKLSLNNLTDSGGKEYSRSVLFGDYDELYVGLICTHYGIYKTDKDLGKYVKLHIDDGLQLINEEFQKVNNIDGFDFLVEMISEKVLTC